MNSGISIDQLSEEIKTALENYNKFIVEGTKQKAKESMDKIVKETKATAPKHRPRYYKHITSKQTRNNSFGAEYTWYVSGSEYRLSHLLENGHAKRNGGRVGGTHFIKNASESIMEEYIKAIEEVIKNG